MTSEISSTGPVTDYASFFRASFSRTAKSVESIAGTAAEDVAQEAFIAALSSWDRVSVLEAPEAWVRLVAKRIAWRRRRRETSRRGLEAGTTVAPPAPSYDEVLSIDLQRAIRDLPTRERAAIQLHYLADLPVTDVARILRCTEAAAKVWLYRARERIAETLIGHRGRWVGEGRWSADGVVTRMRETGDAAFVDPVIAELSPRSTRWALTLRAGAYTIESDSGERLDHGRYRIGRTSIVLTPWDKSGIVRLAPTIEGGRARFALTADTTAPTRGVPDEVYIRLLLASDSFTRTGTHRRSSPDL